ncbi:pyruvate dehydrogenase (acetyl-transferring) E1 component subunit alpha [Halobacteriales archaeon QS_8_69_26]|nr:MAG: pyruvate dehydrogenase (acetyl-transferring) E1 component subunit alpha [Halobacteriales archaeon QS_8_69_26]
MATDRHPRDASIGGPRRDHPDDGCIVQLLDEDGHLRQEGEPPSIPEDELLELYEGMRFARRFDERALSLQRQGRIATYAPMRGQEAAQVASARALADDDWIYPTYRDNAAKIVHGLDPADILAALRGHQSGYAVPDGVNVMPEYIPIATQIPQATGGAWAETLQDPERDPDTAYLCYFGDGATSEGDFHEGLNFAGVFDVPAVFFCNNNQWSISTPVERQTRSGTLAGKARAYGLEGIRVDGMDPLAVYEVTRRAVSKAKDPAADELRPTMIEAVQYRYGAHTSSDDPSRYRDGVDEEWADKDPIPRLATYLRDRELIDDEYEADLDDRIDAEIDAAVDRMEAVETDPAEMFDHVYAERTPELADQRAELERLRAEYGDEALAGDGQ